MPTIAKPGPTVFVLFGASGDLAHRMVLPAFYTLAEQGLLPDNWRLIGNGRGDVAHLDFVARVRESLEQFGPRPKPRAWSAFKQRISFAGGDLESDAPGSLRHAIAEAQRDLSGRAQLVHYLAIPPQAFGPLTDDLGRHGLARNARVVYEKPFGTSASEFRKLERTVHRVLDESQVYRIDHFLGKEATQDLHVLRFANSLFASAWSRDHVRAVQIDCPETLGVADRADFYDHTGAVLDMLVTHLFQLAAEVAMEPPPSLDAGDLQAARESIISRFRPLSLDDTVFGQYAGYRDLAGISPTSRTETFVATRLWVDTPRWRGVPFLLRTGKRLHQTHQSVSLILRDPDGPLRKLPADGNVVRFALDGGGEIDVRMVVKRPGVGLTLGTATSCVPVSGIPHADPLPPYVRLIHDVLLGDRSLFTRPDGLAHVWKVATPLLGRTERPRPYAPGSWGPPAAKKLAAPDGWLLGQ
jgi:glucose-6-phosphate 1-dehydrogenase